MLSYDLFVEKARRIYARTHRFELSTVVIGCFVDAARVTAKKKEEKSHDVTISPKRHRPRDLNQPWPEC
jgi:hypothetical protein